MRDQGGISGGQRPTAQPGMRDEQAIEGIASPAEGQGFLEPVRGRRIVERPQVVAAGVSNGTVSSHVRESRMDRGERRE